MKRDKLETLLIQLEACRDKTNEVINSLDDISSMLDSEKKANEVREGISDDSTSLVVIACNLQYWCEKLEQLI